MEYFKYIRSNMWNWIIIISLLFINEVKSVDCNDYEELQDSTLIQDNYLYEKRMHPSSGTLSIVNPLDVLRQRLILETARRHQKDQDRKVEINRQILKQVGKRIFKPHHTNLLDFLQDDEKRWNIHSNRRNTNHLLKNYIYNLR